MLPLNPGETATGGAVGEWVGRQGIGAFEAEEADQVVVAEAIKEAGVPTEGSGGDGSGREGMPDIVVAVAERAFPVLPSLTPDDGGEGEDEETFIQRESRQLHGGAELEGVVFGGVVGEERGGGKGK